MILSACGLSGRWTALSTRTTAPPRHSAGKISITDMSKQTELAAEMPLMSRPSKIRSISDSMATQPPWWMATPFGTPVDPEV